jgi:hypothetical protein
MEYDLTSDEEDVSCFPEVTSKIKRSFRHSYVAVSMMPSVVN